MFYNQPLAHRFGKELNDNIRNPIWEKVEIAVAWVRHSGTRHLNSAVRSFLANGGAIQITVGVDIENTSIEGLTDLLSWESCGNVETHVYHNEASSTFHPKVYLFRNRTNARLIVGSNNLTEAGLFVNTEAGLQHDAPLSDSLITGARTALSAWRDTTTGFAKRLDTTLLNDLTNLGYVFSERSLQARRPRRQPGPGGNTTGRGQALFGRQNYSVPPIIAPSAPIPTAAVSGTVLLMRVRRASATARRTQIQIPIKVVNTNFFSGISAITSAHDARNHLLIQATARGIINTIKAEIPEIDTMNDPVLRLERSANGITYQAFDASSILGTPIYTALQNGFTTSPPATLSSIANRAHATWWRFI